ncbi:FAD-binding oxidoreductase [Merismopedia glauca]|uniref:Oxidase n=1 Tax=Merismopedia glauca CCAP 1448/3 TaxID=1296344 RepID=A0A2T1C4F3_9CYAN|nr:FAD-binding oxidoreductase [Merismopedia glauca]PSB03017.1 oxidase [Merismopedia glauca CCAP 1448/3]
MTNKSDRSSNNALWGHKWGYADTSLKINEDRSVIMTGDRYALSGYKMPYLIPYIEELLDIKIELKDVLEEVKQAYITPPNCNADFTQAIADLFPAHQYSFEDSERLLHSHGQTTFEEVHKVLYSQLERLVDMVFYCESTADAQKLIELAIKYDVCLVPFGGGTSVSCALKLPLTETRAIVSVDMKRMNRLEWIDRENLRACFQAGITGKQLEAELRQHGFVCGHEPDSLELSTLGGWIATNASGMKKNRYGNIEQIVENITLLTPTGVIEQIAPTPRASMGMQLQNLLFGNEGNLGLIIQAVIKIHPLPQVTKYGSLIFPNFDLGVKFLYEVAHSGFIPASIRLVDNNQFRFGQALKPKSSSILAYLDKLKKFYVLKLRGFDPQQMVAATIVMEGAAEEVAYQQTNIYALAKKFQGLATGATNGQRGYMLTYAIAYLRDFLSSYYITGETFETSVPWSEIQQVCNAVAQQLQELHRQYNLPGKPYLSYRISQSYHTGVCIYFMFAVYIKGVEHPEVICGQIEHSLRQTIIANGGSISHHHGVGKIRQDFMKDTLSPASIELLRQIKKASDPQNIFGVRNNILAESDI